MNNILPTEIAGQVSQACAIAERHLAAALRAIHLYGSALDGGLKPCSEQGITDPAQSHFHLAALRWPEQTLVLENGQVFETVTTV